MPVLVQYASLYFGSAFSSLTIVGYFAGVKKPIWSFTGSLKDRSAKFV